MQKPNENIHMYIIKYANLHQTVTRKRPEQETDQSHLTKFLTSMWKYQEKYIDEVYHKVLPYKASF